MGKSLYKLVNGIVLSVEKGNMDTANAERPVCAFSVSNQEDNVKVKVLLKGDFARKVWDNNLKDKMTANKAERFPSSEYNMEHEEYTCVDIVGPVREVRKNNEIVIENPYELVFYKNCEYRAIADE